jgi:hypothetical protein
MHPLSRIPGFLMILTVGVVVISYSVTLDINPNWVLAVGIILVILGILSITVVR